jgi:hypothetical protein
MIITPLLLPQTAAFPFHSIKPATRSCAAAMAFSSGPVEAAPDGTDLAGESSQGAGVRHCEFAPDQASLGPAE